LLFLNVPVEHLIIGVAAPSRGVEPLVGGCLDAPLAAGAGQLHAATPHSKGELVLVPSRALWGDYTTSAPPEVDMDDALSNAKPVCYEKAFFALPSTFLPPSLKVTCNNDL